MTERIMGEKGTVTDWLPPGKKAALCFTIDDVRPARYDGGGDLDRGALCLLERHPKLHVTLFTTPDWRETTPLATSRAWHIPFLRDHLYLAPLHPAGKMRLSRHPAFVDYLRRLPRTESGFHGFHHVHQGPTVLIDSRDRM